MLLVLFQQALCILSFVPINLWLFIFIVPRLSCGVLQWLSISSHWAFLWTLMMAVSRTTGAVATS